MLPCQSKGAPSCPSSTVEPVLPGDAQPASLSPEVGAGGIYTPSSAPNQTRELGNALLNICSLSIFFN